MLKTLWHAQRHRLAYWLPAILTGLIAGVAFIIIGQTPWLRAAALAIAVVGMALSLQHLGMIYAIGGGLLFAFSPAYWSQTGGPPTVDAWLILLFIIVGAVVALALLTYKRHLFNSIALGVTIFVGLYLVVGLTQKSLRLTTILAAWSLYMTVVALRQTNPRPEDPPAKPLSRRHINGVLLMLVLGVLNDPLITLYAPAVILGLWLSRANLPHWYWLLLGVVLAFGAVRIGQVYISPDWFWQPTTDQIVPYIIFDGWRDPERWLALTAFMAQQFSIVGLFLGVIGIARLARWYPTLGIVMLIAYSSYGVFGLVYFGADARILLLPMMMIQVFCITYAVYSLVQWLRQGLPTIAQSRRTPPAKRLKTQPNPQNTLDA
jgi:hypothetical protein